MTSLVPSTVQWVQDKDCRQYNITMGAFGGTAVLFLVISFRMTEQSNLAPFSYFGIPMAAFFGWLFFDETPFDDLFPGAVLIIAGGLLVIWRERRLNS